MAGLLRSHQSVAVCLALVLVLGVLILSPSINTAAAEPCHHVVGGKRGWDVASDIAQWSLGKVFRVGDRIWFKYSAADESVVEMGSLAELDACDVSNPIRTYTEGVNEVVLDGEGPRYFASGKKESCKCGLKLHIAVLPQPEISQLKPVALVVPRNDQQGAAAPADSPSACGSTSLAVSLLMSAGAMALLGLVIVV